MTDKHTSVLENNNELSSLGKIPPQAIDIEQAILGALLIESKSIHQIAKDLKPEYFYKDSHSTIYEAILDLYQESSQIDILTVTEQLRKRKSLDLCGGAYYITELTSKVNSAAHLESHCKIVIEKWMLRQIAFISANVNAKSFDNVDDPFGLLDKSITDLMDVLEQVLRGRESDYSSLLDKSMELTYERAIRDDAITGIPTPFAELDKIIGGLNAPDLVILAARPGMGKTAMALQIALYAAMHNYPTAVFSLEMSALQLTQRTQSLEAEITLNKILRGDIQDYEMNRLQHVSDKLKQARLYIDDTAGMSLTELRAKCHMMKHKHNIKLIVVDYLQLMSYDGSNRDEAVGRISKGMKAIAKDLDVPLIALSQLSRAVELRGGSKRPQLSDLRESGSIEADADTVWFIYRPEYYGILRDENSNDLTGLAELIIAKNRQGALDTIDLRFIGKWVKFKDYVPAEVVTTTENKEDEEPPPF